MNKHVVIIGNGVAGITCARHLRKRSDEVRITVISAESKYFYSRTALMYIYMGHMKQEHTQPYENGFWEKNRIELVFDYVESIDANSKNLSLRDGSSIAYDELVIASGSKPNMFGWKGQDLKGVGGLYSLQDLEYMEKYTNGIQKAVVVGGGLIGVEMAEMLHSRGIKVDFLVREKHFWGNVLPEKDAELVEHQFQRNHVKLLLNNELDEIIGDEKGRVKAVRTKTGEEIACQWVGLTAGVSPNIAFTNSSGIETNRGILVDSNFNTSLPNVYAIGDCAEFRVPAEGRRPIEQVWYTGKFMGELLARNLCGETVSYKPGIWFNSAKFFDLEYQTYGTVTPSRSESEAEFYWQDAELKNALHFVFDKESLEFIGLNTFGMRIRHSKMDAWLGEKVSIETVLSELKDANFDPEFYKKYEGDIIAQYNKTFNRQVILKKKSWTRIFSRS